MVLKSIFAEVEEPYAATTRFTYEPELHYEHIGQIKLFDDEISNVAYLNLTQYDYKFDHLCYYFNNIQQICLVECKRQYKWVFIEILDTLGVCDIIQMAMQGLTIIQFDKINLEQLVGHIQYRIVENSSDDFGTILKILFSMRKYYEQKIAQYKENDINLAQLVNE